MTNTKDNIRKILVARGRQLVQDKGADYLTARKLEEASGYSVGTIYNQFGTMDNFVLEQNKQTLDELIRFMMRTPKGESSYQMLNRYLDAFVALCWLTAICGFCYIIFICTQNMANCRNFICAS